MLLRGRAGSPLGRTTPTGRGQGRGPATMMPSRPSLLPLTLCSTLTPRARRHRARSCTGSACARVRPRLGRRSAPRHVATGGRGCPCLTASSRGGARLRRLEAIEPLQHRPWLGALVVSGLLRARRKARHHLPCLNLALRQVPYERRRARDQPPDWWPSWRPSRSGRGRGPRITTAGASRAACWNASSPPAQALEAAGAGRPRAGAAAGFGRPDRGRARRDAPRRPGPCRRARLARNNRAWALSRLEHTLSNDDGLNAPLLTAKCLYPRRSSGAAPISKREP